MKLRAPLLAAALTAGLLNGAAAGEASVYYFDHDYRISFDLSQVIEDISSATGTVKLARTATSVTYTDGARFVVDRPEDLTGEELARTTSYAELGSTELLRGGHSLLLVPPPLLDALAPVVEERMRAYFTVERVPARLLAGTSPSGIRFTAVELASEIAKPLWEPTLEMRHYVSFGGHEALLTGISVPMGLNGLSRSMVEAAADKKNAVMLSLGLGGTLTGQILNSGPAKTLEYLAAAGTDIAAMDPNDLRNFLLWTSAGPVRTPPGSPELICSNVEISTPPLAALVKPYALRRIGGGTVAFISFVPANSGALADLEGTPVSVRDPRDERALYALINELRGRYKADAVVAIAPQLKRDELGWLMSARGIDALIGPKTWDSGSVRRTRVTLRNWAREAHTGPALTVFPDSAGSGLLRLEFTRRGELAALESLPPPDDGREPLYYKEQLYMKERIVRHFLGSGDKLLPELRPAGGPAAGPAYGVPDLYNLAAGLLRKELGAEVAVLRVKPFSSSMVGDIPTAMVKTWLGPDKPLALVLAPGRFINDLRSRQVPPRAPGAYYTPQDYAGMDYYALSGVDRYGRVSGLPLNDSELYLTALPAELAEGKRFLRPAAPPPGAPKTLYGAVIGGLEKLRAEASSREDWEARVEAAVRNEPPRRNLWRVNLRGLSLSMVNTDVSGPSAYANINESQLSAVNQTQVQGSGRLYSEYYSGKFRFDAGVSADYGKNVLRPRGQPHLTAESVDQLTYETQLIYRMRNYNGRLGRMVVGPYASAAYDTEFSRQDSLPLKKVVRGSAGMKLFEGAALQELYAGLTTEQVYTYSPARTKYAVETGFSLSLPLPGTALQLSADGNYRNFARSRFDTIYDLKQRLELNVKVSTRLYGDVMISPYLNFYLAQGKKLPGSAYNLTTGFALEYSRLFKLKR